MAKTRRKPHGRGNDPSARRMAKKNKNGNVRDTKGKQKACGGTQNTTKERRKSAQAKGKQKACGGTQNTNKERRKSAQASGGSQAWNKGRKMYKLNKQHVCVPREQLPLFFAATLFWAGPVYAAILWLALSTSRRISETLLLRACDIQISGGEFHDEPHVLYTRRPEDEKWKGAGKLAPVGENIIARLSEDAITGLTCLRSHGLKHECREGQCTHNSFSNNH